MAEVVRFDSAERLATAVAERFLDFLADEQAAGRIPQVALAGGSVADAIHREVARLAPASGVDWLGVEFWWSDERFVSADSPDRNSLQARLAFLDEVGATRLHPMPTPESACAVDEGARAYEAQVRSVALDLVMLGVGPDGHVASLFPGLPAMRVTDSLVVGVLGAPKPPPNRLTLTLPALNSARQVWLVAGDSGEGGAKHDAVAAALAGNDELPAARVCGRESTTWLLS